MSFQNRMTITEYWPSPSFLVGCARCIPLWNFLHLWMWKIKSGSFYFPAYCYWWSPLSHTYQFLVATYWGVHQHLLNSTHFYHLSIRCYNSTYLKSSNYRRLTKKNMVLIRLAWIGNGVSSINKIQCWILLAYATDLLWYFSFCYLCRFLFLLFLQLIEINEIFYFYVFSNKMTTNYYYLFVS